MSDCLKEGGSLGEQVLVARHNSMLINKKLFKYLNGQMAPDNPIYLFDAY